MIWKLISGSSRGFGSTSWSDECQAVKRVFFTSIYPTLIVNLGMICYLKECTQFVAVIC